MINLVRGQINTIIVTLTEKSTDVDSPPYLFVAKNKETNEINSYITLYRDSISELQKQQKNNYDNNKEEDEEGEGPGIRDRRNVSDNPRTRRICALQRCA